MEHTVIDLHEVREAGSAWTPTSSTTLRRGRRAVTLARVGAMGRAMAALTAHPLAPESAATEAALRTLHPSVEDPLPPWLSTFAPPTPISLPLAQVTAALRSANRLSSAGPSGQSFEHLRDLFLGGEGLAQFGELCTHHRFGAYSFLCHTSARSFYSDPSV